MKIGDSPYELLECVHKTNKSVYVASVGDDGIAVYDYDRLEFGTQDPLFVESFNSMNDFLCKYDPSEGKVDAKRLLRKLFHNEASFNQFMRENNASQK